MPEELLTQPLFILITGLLVVASMFARAGLERLGWTPVLGYLVIGLAMRVADEKFRFIPEQAHWSFEFLAQLGVICLLFRVGLESDLSGLVRQLPSAAKIWISDVVFSAVLAFLVSRYVLGEALIPSLFVATALSATSVGVTMAVWQEAKALKTSLGEELTDVAELDDISAIVLMVFLFAAIPALREGGDDSLGAKLLSSLAGMLGKAIIFGALCLVFSRYLERPLTKFATRFADPILPIVGVSFIVAALAGWLGFSVAIGALFAGLLFSRDPEAVKLEGSFMPIYDLFTPFFFLAIGLQMNPGALLSSAGIGLVLLLPAAVGKVVGAGIPVFFSRGAQAATLLGVSMLPRAEIALIVVHTGNKLGDWAVSDSLYGALVFVSLATCLIAPQLVKSLLVRWRDTITGSERQR